MANLSADRETQNVLGLQRRVRSQLVGRDGKQAFLSPCQEPDAMLGTPYAQFHFILTSLRYASSLLFTGWETGSEDMKPLARGLRAGKQPSRD